MRGKENGFTLSELLVVTLIIGIALTLGAPAFSRYWKVRSLNAAVDEVATELRGDQQDATSQSHPWVWGAWFKQGTPRWGIVRGNANTGACEVRDRRSFPAGVTVSAVSFADVTTPTLSAQCAAAAESGAEVVLFFARGSATGGSVSLSHPEVGGGSARTITVAPITGRVTKP